MMVSCKEESILFLVISLQILSSDRLINRSIMFSHRSINIVADRLKSASGTCKNTCIIGNSNRRHDEYPSYNIGIGILAFNAV